MTSFEESWQRIEYKIAFGFLILLISISFGGLILLDGKLEKIGYLLLLLFCQFLFYKEIYKQ